MTVENIFMRQLHLASHGFIYALMFLVPLFLLPVTIEPLEINKQTLVIILTCVSTLFWLGSMLVGKRVVLKSGLINLVPILIATAFVVPAIFSSAQYISWIGAHRQEYTSVLTISALCVLFYVLAHTFGERQQHRIMHATLIFSTFVAVFVALIDLLWFPIFGSLSTVLSHNTVGTLTSFTIFLIAMNTFFLSSWVSHKKNDSLLSDDVFGIIERVLGLFVSVSTFFFLLVLDDGLLWLMFAISIIFPFVFVFFRAKDFPDTRRLLWPLVLLAAALVFWFWLPGLRLLNVPLEVTPNSASSMLVAEETLKTYSSAFGSGSGTYVMDFAQFHGVEFNQTDFWNTRFDRASSFALTLLPTIGIFGVTLLSLFLIVLFARAIAQVLRPISRDEWLESFVHLAPWFVLVVSAFLFPWNITLVVMFAIFSGLLASQIMRKKIQFEFRRSPVAALMSSVGFISLSFILLVGVFLSSQRYLADMAFTRAVELDRGKAEIQQVVAQLDRATRLNRFSDTYHRNLGEALLIRLKEELKGVDSVDTLTSESAQYVQSIIAASVNAATLATELSPNNVLNWLSRGSIYKELVPVMGSAGEFAIMSYTRATELESANPYNWTELGKAYLVSAASVRELTAAQDSKTASEAHRQYAEMLDHAQSAFERAIELRPEYAPAHFQLGMTYDQQGRLNDAIGKMESIAKYNPLDVGVHFQLGTLYLKRNSEGDRERAQEAFESAVKISPDFSNAHWFLASIYEGQGDMASAVREVEAVLRQNPDNEIVNNRLLRLLRGDVEQDLPEVIE